MNLIENTENRERTQAKIAIVEEIFNGEVKIHEKLTQSDAPSFSVKSDQVTENCTTNSLEVTQNGNDRQCVVNGQTLTANKVPSENDTSSEQMSTNDKVPSNDNCTVSSGNNETVTEATSKSELIQNGHSSKELSAHDQVTENGIRTVSTAETVTDAKSKLEVIQNGHASDHEVNNSHDERLVSRAVQLENQELSDSVESNSEISKSGFPIKEDAESNEPVLKEVKKSENMKVLEKPGECKSESTNKVEQLSDTAISKEPNENNTQAKESEASKSIEMDLSEEVTNADQKVSDKELMQNYQVPTSKDLSENSKAPLPANASAPVKTELNAISADDIKQEIGEELNPPSVKIENPQVVNGKKRRGRKSKAEKFTEMAEKALEGGIMIFIDV